MWTSLFRFSDYNVLCSGGGESPGQQVLPRVDMPVKETVQLVLSRQPSLVSGAETELGPLSDELTPRSGDEAPPNEAIHLEVSRLAASSPSEISSLETTSKNESEPMNLVASEAGHLKASSPTGDEAVPLVALSASEEIRLEASSPSNNEPVHLTVLLPNEEMPLVASAPSDDGFASPASERNENANALVSEDDEDRMTWTAISRWAVNNGSARSPPSKEGEGPADREEGDDSGGQGTRSGPRRAKTAPQRGPLHTDGVRNDDEARYVGRQP